MIESRGEYVNIRPFLVDLAEHLIIEPGIEIKFTEPVHLVAE